MGSSEHILLKRLTFIKSRAIIALALVILECAARITSLIDDLPQVKGDAALGNELHVSNDLKKVMNVAQNEAKSLGDSFLASEHLLLAILEVPTKTKDIFHALGLTRANALSLLKEIRGNMQVTDPEPESKYQALEKYCGNLTKKVREGKIDPVIGRDEEIRRVMQVLSRRTKNNPVLIGEAGTANCQYSKLGPKGTNAVRLRCVAMSD